MADFCIEVGDKVELVGRVADFFVVVGEGLFDKAPESKMQMCYDFIQTIIAMREKVVYVSLFGPKINVNE